MEILFGKHLDGSRGVMPEDSLGRVSLGPQGFLALLETHLGLLREGLGQGERIVRYAAILDRHKAGAFYERSFDLDALGTARTLLGWRDTWYLHGWKGSFPPGCAPRLAEMARLEAAAAQGLDHSEGERLHRVARALAQGLRVPISRLDLLEDLSRYPHAWQVVLSFFSPGIRPPGASGQGGFLSRLQARLLDSVTDSEPLAWRDDGSVTVLQAESPLLAAHAMVPELQERNDSRLLVAGAHAPLLDEVLLTHGLPELGLDERSVFRPALQVLPLALQQLWNPVDVYALLEFLTHPVCPVPAFARRGIAGIVAAAPGMDVDAWMQWIADHAPDDAQKVLAESAVCLYLAGGRHDPEAGAPLRDILLVARELAGYFRKRLVAGDPTACEAAQAGWRQCATFVSLAEARADHGVETVRIRELQLLVEQATGIGVEHGLSLAQAGAPACVTHPGAVGSPFAQVIWWCPVLPDLPRNYPWSLTELSELRAAGVSLPPLTDVMAWSAEEWLYPVLAAKDNLTVVLPPQAEEVHPVWQMIQAACPSIPVHALEEAVFQGRVKGARPVAVRSLPPLRARWTLPPGAIPTTREVDSYSSLNSQINNPSAWVLSYVARLRESSQLSIPDSHTLKGTLAHRMIEKLFDSNGLNALEWSDKELEAWFDKAFAFLIDREGAVFRMPGNHNECDMFRYQLLKAIRSLVRILKASSVCALDPEAPLEGRFEGGALQGTADLVLTLPGDQAVIMDLKWRESVYTDRLKENRQLQLALYGELYRQMGHAFAKPAYFILSESHLLFVDAGLFPGEQPVEKNEDLGAGPELWQAFLKTWRWRQTQLKRGEIHVVTEATASGRELAPDDAYPLDEPSDRYNPYVALCGWSDDQ